MIVNFFDLQCFFEIYNHYLLTMKITKYKYIYHTLASAWKHACFQNLLCKSKFLCKQVSTYVSRKSYDNDYQIKRPGVLFFLLHFFFALLCKDIFLSQGHAPQVAKNSFTAIFLFCPLFLKKVNEIHTYFDTLFSILGWKKTCNHLLP